MQADLFQETQCHTDPTGEPTWTAGVWKDAPEGK